MNILENIFESIENSRKYFQVTWTHLNKYFCVTQKYSNTFLALGSMNLRLFSSCWVLPAAICGWKVINLQLQLFSQFLPSLFERMSTNSSVYCRHFLHSLASKAILTLITALLPTTWRNQHLPLSPIPACKHPSISNHGWCTKLGLMNYETRSEATSIWRAFVCLCWVFFARLMAQVWRWVLSNYFQTTPYK